MQSARNHIKRSVWLFAPGTLKTAPGLPKVIVHASAAQRHGPIFGGTGHQKKRGKERKKKERGKKMEFCSEAAENKTKHCLLE